MSIDISRATSIALDGDLMKRNDGHFVPKRWWAESVSWSVEIKMTMRKV